MLTIDLFIQIRMIPMLRKFAARQSILLELT